MGSPHAVARGLYDPDVIVALQVSPELLGDYVPGEPKQLAPARYKDAVDETVTNGKALAATRRAVDALFTFLADLARFPAAECLALSTAKGNQLHQVSDAVNHALSYLAGMSRSLGDVSAINDRFGDVTSAILSIADNGTATNDLVLLGERVSTLHDAFTAHEAAFQNDIYESVKVALDRVQLCFERLAQVKEDIGAGRGGVPWEVGGSTQLHLPLSVDTVVVGASGGAILSLGDIVRRLDDLEHRAQSAEARVTKLEALLTKQGGDVLDNIPVRNRAEESGPRDWRRGRRSSSTRSSSPTVASWST